MQLANKEISRLQQEGHTCLSIPLGGANELGTLGFVAGFVEMVTQMKELNISADYVFHANGSGGTMVGLNIGKILLHEVVKIISVDAAPNEGEDASVFKMTVETSAPIDPLVEAAQSAGGKK